MLSKIKYQQKKILRFLIILLAFVMSQNIYGSSKITLEDVTSGKFSAKLFTSIRPISGTDEYLALSSDNKKIEEYKFSSSQPVEILFSSDDYKGKADLENIDGYIVSPDYSIFLIRTNTKPVYRRSNRAKYYIYYRKSKALKQLTNDEDIQIPTFSPDSRKIAFVRQNNIFIADAATLSVIQITKDGQFNHIINGLPDWVNEEEFGFNNAMAWSSDSKYLCWLKYDETDVKTYSLQMYKGMEPECKENSIYPSLYSYKYPKAGEQNSIVSVWKYDIQKENTAKIDLPLPKDGYIPRLLPTGRPDCVVAYTMNRHQDELNIYSIVPSDGSVRKILTEKSNKYVKEEAMEGITLGKEHILLPSDRDGFMHLYLYDYSGKLVRQIEKGNYDITNVYGYDENSGRVYYQAAKLNAHDRQVYMTDKKGITKRLTAKAGTNDAVFAGNYKYFVNIWSNYDTPYEITTCSGNGKELSVIEDNKELKEIIKEYGWIKKDTFSFITSEGVRLDGWMVRPENFQKDKKYPVILFQYSGPGNQQVLDSWSTGSMGQGGAFDMYLAQKGYIVVCVDGRGTGGRGSDFEKCTYLKIGDLESRDQVETALYMSAQPFVDKNKIGIWGWSFGGFNTLMSMSEGRKVFRAGVAVAPPTNWRYYDTIYTERYMRTPQENADGYAINPIERASKLNGSLLICHGTADDNVHPQNTFEYAEALVQADKDFKEVYYTNRNHGIRGGNSRNHLLRQISQWFDEKMKL